jgi:hypothetical protein
MARSPGPHNSTVRDSDPLVLLVKNARQEERVTEGMIGFDIACETVRSGSRMQGYLVNDLCKQ